MSIYIYFQESLNFIKSLFFELENNDLKNEILLNISNTEDNDIFSLIPLSYNNKPKTITTDKYIIYLSNYNKLSIYDLKENKIIYDIIHSSEIMLFNLNDDKTILYSYSISNILLTNIDTFCEIISLNYDYIKSIEFSENNNIIAFETCGKIIIFNIFTKQLIKILDISIYKIICVIKFIPNSSKIIYTIFENLFIYDYTLDIEIFVFNGSSKDNIINFLFINPSDNNLFINSYGPHYEFIIDILNLNTYSIQRYFKQIMNETIVSKCFKYFACFKNDNILSINEINSSIEKNFVFPFKQTMYDYKIKFSNDEKYIMLYSKKHIIIFNILLEQIVNNLEFENDIENISLITN